MGMRRDRRGDHALLELIPSIILLILYYKFFYIVPLPGTHGGRTNMVLPILFTWAMAGFLFLRSMREIEQTWFHNYFIALFFFFAIEILYTSIAYPDEPLSGTISEFTTYTLLLSYHIFSFGARRNFEGLIKVVVIIGTAVAIMYIGQAFLYNNSKIFVLSIEGVNRGAKRVIDLRNGRIRLLAADLTSFTAMISIGKIFSGHRADKEKTLYWINFAVTVLYELYATQTRSMLMILLAVFALTMLKYGSKNVLLNLVILFMGILCVMIEFKEITEVLSGFQEMLFAGNDYSITHRYESYIYYFGRGVQSPIFGIGLLRDTPATMENYHIVHSATAARFCYSDVGVVGLLGKLGFVGGAFYIYPIWKSYRIYKQRSENSAMVFSIVIGFLLSMVNLCLFDSERILIYALYITLIEYTLKRDLDR